MSLPEQARAPRLIRILGTPGEVGALRPALPDRLLTADEVALRLRVSVTQVYRLAQSGALPAVRVGRLVRFSEARFAEYVARGGTR